MLTAGTSPEVPPEALQEALPETSQEAPAMDLENTADDENSPQTAVIVGRESDGLLDAMLESYTKSVNAKDFADLRTFAVGPEQLSCSVGDKEKDYITYLSSKLSREIPPGYKTTVRPLADDAPLPNTDLVEYPIRPTHYAVMELKGAKAEPGAKTIQLGATIIQYLFESDGSWAFIFGCPTEEGFKKLREAKAGSPAP